MLPVPDFAWRELIVTALFLWLLCRYTLMTLAATLVTLGLMMLAMLPAGLPFCLLPLGLIGAGIGLLLYHYQVHSERFYRRARTPQTYRRPQDEFHS